MCALCLWSRSDVIDAAQHEPAAWLGTLGEQALILVPAPSRDGVAELAQLELVPLSSLWSLDRSAAAEQLLEEARQMLLPAALWRLRVTRTPDAEDLEPEDAFRFVAWLVSQPKGVVRQARPEVCALESVLLEGRPHETFLDALELSEVGLARTQWQHLCN
jgi:hypothetical protein